MYALYSALSSGKRENHQGGKAAPLTKPHKSPIKPRYEFSDKTYHKANKKRLNSR
jgi:hypothetical protein